ncbi:PTS system, Fru family, IIB component domain protein, partial [Vibrio cholerae HC-28A1]
MKMKI